MSSSVRCNVELTTRGTGTYVDAVVPQRLASLSAPQTKV